MKTSVEPVRCSKCVPQLPHLMLSTKSDCDAGSLITGSTVDIRRSLRLHTRQSGGKTITTAGIKEAEGSTEDVQDRTSQAHEAARAKNQHREGQVQLNQLKVDAHRSRGGEHQNLHQEETRRSKMNHHE